MVDKRLGTEFVSCAQLVHRALHIYIYIYRHCKFSASVCECAHSAHGDAINITSHKVQMSWHQETQGFFVVSGVFECDM